MKKIYAILCIAIASLTQLQAQAPQGFNYQATVRNSSGDLILNTNVYFKFNVIQGSLTAVPVFTETHYVSTDDLGQVNLVIGQGTANSGSFSALDWSLGSYYLGIELDTGNGYLAMGTTQLLSVPYALYAENSGNSTPTTPSLETVLAENNSAGQQQIKDLQDPTEAQDAVTKAYIDDLITNLQNQIDDLESDNDDDCPPSSVLVYGTQEWSGGNACNITYRDGTPIPQVTDQTEWSNLSTGAWCYYDNDPAKGKLYNWYAVMGIHDTDPNTPNKEFAPEGWHVPSDAEWTTLENYLITNGYNYDGTTTGNKIGKAMASITGWSSSTEIGAPGNDQSLNNRSYFNAFPSGTRYPVSSFGNSQSRAYYWSSTEVFLESTSALFRLLGREWFYLNSDQQSKKFGFSVRFVRDSEANSNAQVNPVNDVVICHGDDLPTVTFTTTNTQGTTQYYWTNDNDSTGIPLSGSGNQFSPGGVFNPISEPQVSTITVTPELTFQGQTTTGPSETFTVTVNPSGQVNQVEDITVNSGEIVNEIIFSTSNSSDATSYIWTNNTPSIGLGASGSGDIPELIVNNSSATPIVGIITVTPIFTNGGVSCVGPSINFTITVNPAGGSITDQDGNTYDYLYYSNQAWTVENAEMVTYRDGTPIPQVTDNTEWENLTTGAWSYINNDPTKEKVYNWYAVMGVHDAASLTDPSLRKEFAPEGWHVPSDDEWTTLENYLIANGYNYDGSTLDEKIAKAMASSNDWNSSNTIGAVGYEQNTNNSSGFSAYPNGLREGYGAFNFIGRSSVFWTTTQLNSNSARNRDIYYNRGYIENYSAFLNYGFSVRFVRN